VTDAGKKREAERGKLIRRLGDIAFGRANDAVKLVFLTPQEAQGALDGLDLSMLSEVKRDEKGTVELKLLNRLDVMKLLLEELKPQESGAAEFLAALERAAPGGGAPEDR